MEYVIFDLEWNTAFVKQDHSFVNEIIEFGAVKLNSRLEEASRFSSFVKPSINSKLRSHVKRLTNISNSDLKDAENYETVSGRFAEWVGDSDDVIFMSWGDTDIRTLISNDQYFYGTPEIPYMDSYLDLQRFFMSEQGLPLSKQLSLVNAAEMVNIDPDTYKNHRALDDSLLTADCLRAVFNKERIREQMIPCDREFYERMLFHPHFVCDINDPSVDRTALNCSCIKCGKPAERTSDWRTVNNSFQAYFRCNDCDTSYRVNVQFRRLYDRVNIKKNVMITDSGNRK